MRKEVDVAIIGAGTEQSTRLGGYDPYNSTPVWMFPFASSALAPTPTAQTLLGGRLLVGNSLRITAYGWYDRSLYLEAADMGPSVRAC